MTLTHKGTRRDGRVPYEISWWQLSMLLVSFHLSLLVSYSPMTAAVLPPMRDAWLAALLAWLPGFGLAILAWWLVKRFEGQHVYEFSRTIFGRVFGTLINIGITVYFINWAIIVTREFSVFMASVVFLRTPEVVFVIVFLTLAIIATSQQVEFIGRTAELAGPLVIGGVLLLNLASIQHMDFGMLRPVLVEGWQPVLRQGLTPMAIYGETAAVVLLVGPYVNKLSDGPKAIGVGMGINVLFATLSAASLISIFGVELLSILAFPALSGARLIEIGDILERLEWIMLLLWFAAMGAKISLVLFGARLGLSALFPRQHPGVALLLASGTVFILSLFLWPTLTDVLNFFQPKTLLPHILPLQLAPILFAVVALIRGAKASHR